MSKKKKKTIHKGREKRVIRNGVFSEMIQPIPEVRGLRLISFKEEDISEKHLPRTVPVGGDVLKVTHGEASRSVEGTQGFESASGIKLLKERERVSSH